MLTVLKLGQKRAPQKNKLNCSSIVSPPPKVEGRSIFPSCLVIVSNLASRKQKKPIILINLLWFPPQTRNKTRMQGFFPFCIVGRQDAVKTQLIRRKKEKYLAKHEISSAVRRYRKGMKLTFNFLICSPYLHQLPKIEISPALSQR